MSLRKGTPRIAPQEKNLLGFCFFMFFCFLCVLREVYCIYERVWRRSWSYLCRYYFFFFHYVYHHVYLCFGTHVYHQCMDLANQPSA